MRRANSRWRSMTLGHDCIKAKHGDEHAGDGVDVTSNSAGIREFDIARRATCSRVRTSSSGRESYRGRRPPGGAALSRAEGVVRERSARITSLV